MNLNWSETVGSVQIDPHKCRFCHKQYASNAKLLQHMRSKHPAGIEGPRPEGGKEPPNPASAGETWKLENLVGGERQAAPAAAPLAQAPATERHRRSIEVPVQQIQFPNEPVQQVQIDSSTTKKTPKLVIVRKTEGKLPKKLLRKSTL